MYRIFVLIIIVGVMASCRSTKKIQTAITKRDSVVTISVPPPVIHQDSSMIVHLDSTIKRNSDTVQKIQDLLSTINSNRINFQTFTAKVNVDYSGSNNKRYNLNVVLRMYKDSAIWISANAILGIEAMRVLVTKDSIKLLDKLNRTYTARSLDYLQEVTDLPLTLSSLQNLIIGNPVFLDSNIVSYTTRTNSVSLLSIGKLFKNLITLSEPGRTLLHSKLDDLNIARNRTADLTYNNYENKKGVPFSVKRRIVVAEKNRLDIKLDFKQYDFNKEVSFPFNVPENYDFD